jgi:hypothetical protein
MREAAARLGVSHTKMWRLVRDGALPVYPNPLDRRQKLVRVEDLQVLAGGGPARRSFLSDGSFDAPDAPQSDEIEHYLREHWHPLAHT